MDLHSALRTEVVGEARGEGLELKAVRLQWDRESIAYSLHVHPNTFSSHGIQRTDLLALLGFRRTDCAFFQSECYVHLISWPFDTSAFVEAFSRTLAKLEEGEKHLEACGILLDHPEGWGFFSGKPSRGRVGAHQGFGGDGHTGAVCKRMKEAEDEHFSYVLSWIDGGPAKGWTMHYHPKHPPLSAEAEAAFAFLSIASFDKCPEFDFEPCRYRFIPFERRDDSIWEDNANLAHGWFGAHAERFSAGIECLLAAQLEMQPFGLSILPQAASQAAFAARPPSAHASDGRRRDAGAEKGYKYAVAVSFAGPQRALAEELANRVRDAGISVFYDSFYPEQLWGKDLPVFFDGVYRKDSRYCVIFVSSEYAERMWTNHERQSAVARAVSDFGREYILPVRVDGTELAGLAPTIGYLSLDEYTIERIAEILIAKVQGQG